jgi:hypothetical protein
MGNLAQGLLPREKGIWTNAEEATDGNYSKYDGSAGWASAKWPATFTLDLLKEGPIKQIRVLLYDGLGHSNQQDKRKYQFEIRLSEDGENFFTFFSNKDNGGNGWYIIDFVNAVEPRFVQLVALQNDANGQFHVVEIEVHDSSPEFSPPSNNLHYSIAGGTLTNTKYFEAIVARALKKANADLEAIQIEVERAKAATDKLVDESDSKALVERFAQFNLAIVDGEKRSTLWLSLAALSGLALFLTLYYFMYCDETTLKYLREVITEFGVEGSKQLVGGSIVLLHYRMALFIASRIVTMSLLLFIFSWLLRSYKTERHNVLVNRHKAMTIATALQLNADEKLKDTPKGEIILEAIRSVFSHQGTGYEKSENGDNAGNTVVHNVRDMAK